MQAAAYTPQAVSGEYDDNPAVREGAGHRDQPHVRLRLTCAQDGYVVSVQNGLNELVIREIVGPERTVGSFVNFGADYLEPGLILVRRPWRGRAWASWTAHTTERITALHSAFLDFDEAAIITDNIFGYLWGKLAYGAQLFVTALTNDSIADCLADPGLPRSCTSPWRRRCCAWLRRRTSSRKRSTVSTRRAFLPDTPAAVSMQSLDEMVVHQP